MRKAPYRPYDEVIKNCSSCRHFYWVGYKDNDNNSFPRCRVSYKSLLFVDGFGSYCWHYKPKEEKNETTV